jgi:hypothetical protein
MQVGFEKEFFLLNEENKPQLIKTNTGIPYDECGWLVEARGMPFNSANDAVYNLKGKIAKITATIQKIHPTFSLSDQPFMIVDRTLRAQAAKTFQKPLVRQNNFYGHETHRNSPLEGIAAIHVSLTSQQRYKDQNGNESHYNVNFDWARIFTKLDLAFKNEIKDAKRNPGFYELKGDGRVEYRSLPANVDLDKLTQVLEEVGL